MQRVWVRYDLSVEETTQTLQVPSYMTNVKGYNVPVYVPYADPYYLPDTPEEFIKPGRGAYFALSTIAYSSFYIDNNNYLV
ncbi:hypothetical protein, partial [Methylobacterium sp. WL7]|uniref:hypothetical protein n=1 Tax=Methylobacterium sp. WL7 TaxID=2603900 RepID=UPI001AEEAFF2